MPRFKKKFFGKAFGDELAKVSVKSGHFKQKNEQTNWSEQLLYGFNINANSGISNLRKFGLIFVFVIVFCLLFTRLIHLQVINGQTYRESANSNRIQVKIVHAPRGVIYDRNGKILAQNEPGFRLIEQSDKARKVSFISKDDALKMELDNDPRFNNLEIDNIRSYPLGKITSHLVGYVGEITEEELNDDKQNVTQTNSELEQTNARAYKLGDRVGRGGVEEVYESVLRGVDGGDVIEVDAQGKKVRTLRQTPPIPGQNLYLSIDGDLQKEAYKNLEKQISVGGSCCGTTVASDPNTGEIIVLASIPSFDPTKIDEYLTSPNSPFLNRAIAGTYPPGSTFKVISAIAGLLSGKITASTQFEDTGILHLGQFSFANWYFSEYGRKEGMVDIVKALKRSNDIYFYNLGQTIGEDQIAKTARDFYFGEKLGIDLPGEVSGLIPDSAWKIKTFDQVWYPGDTLHMAIGQGYVLTTPLQINSMISAIAANGKIYPPHVALKITTEHGTLVKQFRPDPKKTLKIPDQDLALVKLGLEQVPLTGGTAWPLFTFPIKSAGKTGTAEFGDPKNKTHAWYTTYAPADSPKIAVTTLIEAGGEGSTISSPVVKEIMRWYFSPNKANLIKDVNVIATESARTLGE